RLRFLGPILGAAALLGACAVKQPDPPGPPVALPPGFAAGDGPAAVVHEAWWRDFHDPRLNEFVASALQQSPALAQAIARRRMAEAQARIDGADTLPQVSVGLNSARQRQNLPLDDLPLPGGQGGDDLHILTNSHSASLDVSWEL